MEKIINISNLTKDYGHGRGIFDFSFDIKRGEVFGLVGTNGSGKTTTIRNMMGFIKPQNGKITINGNDSWKDAYEIKKSVGYIPGQIDFPDVGTGTDFLKIQADFLGIKDLSYMNKLIDMFKLDSDASLKRMSKGMKQKTAIVAAFMSQPDILIMDEPSTGLDPMMRDKLIELILEQKKKGKTIFLSSHIFKELEDTCDRVAFIHNGKMINIVDRAQYEENMDKQYKIGFAVPKEYQQFLKCNYEILTQNENYNHLVIKINDTQMNRLFKSLQPYNIRYINYQPYTLEWYYTNIIEKQEVQKYV
ncbi:MULTISPECIES: ABC transporter ATP-binding protein [Clostridium]|uniref:ABC transporter ATP-binding protein n=1 Tax=Clostridium frigoriphilum TaxID=443253 RepID=A0ABU7UTR9_9CLOT|nr:ABC transporter ATP-binding protein [Clostridium sp. DSM 17811]MBU3099412.1 ABC transporter ATP-binding protein [Clostridium sp. DSM 17811]